MRGIGTAAAETKGLMRGTGTAAAETDDSTLDEGDLDELFYGENDDDLLHQPAFESVLADTGEASQVLNTALSDLMQGSADDELNQQDNGLDKKDEHDGDDNDNDSLVEEDNSPIPAGTIKNHLNQGYRTHGTATQDIVGHAILEGSLSQIVKPISIIAHCLYDRIVHSETVNIREERHEIMEQLILLIRLQYPVHHALPPWIHPTGRKICPGCDKTGPVWQSNRTASNRHLMKYATLWAAKPPGAYSDTMQCFICDGWVIFVAKPEELSMKGNHLKRGPRGSSTVEGTPEPRTQAEHENYELHLKDVL